MVKKSNKPKIQRPEPAVHRSMTVHYLERKVLKRLKVIEDEIAAKKRELKKINSLIRLLEGVPKRKHRAILKAIGASK